jgi:hypothetical protein
MAVTSKLAYGVYSYSAVATGVGEVGRVDYDSAVTTPIPALVHFQRNSQLPGTADGNIAGLTPDPKVFWFENDGADGDKGRLLVSQTYYDASRSANKSLFGVYKASDLSQAWPTNNGGGVPWDTTIVNVYNITTLTVNGIEYIYGIDYDNHRIFRVETGTDWQGNELYTFDSAASYSYARAGVEFSYGVDIATDGTDIYGLFINAQAQYGGPYYSSTVVKLPPALGTPEAVNIGLAKNALSLKLWTDSSGAAPVSYFYVPAIGGPQNMDNTYNTESVIQRVDTNLSAVQTLLVNDQSGGTGGGADKIDYYDIAFNAGGTKVFVLKGKYTNSSTFLWQLFLTDMAAVNANAGSGALISAVVTDGTYKVYVINGSGYFWALYYNTADDNVWLVEGKTIEIYDRFKEDMVTNLHTKAGPIGMGSLPASFLAPSGFSLNGAAIYGLVGTVKGAPHPLGGAARAAAAEGEEEEER